MNGGDDDSDSGSSSGDESMEMADVDPSNMADMTPNEPARPPAPTVDADGWTVVSSRRNRR